MLPENPAPHLAPGPFFGADPGWPVGNVSQERSLQGGRHPERPIWTQFIERIGVHRLHSSRSIGMPVLIRDLMVVACVERRFGAIRSTRAFEWLADEGSASRAKHALGTTIALGVPLASTTPVGSGMPRYHCGVWKDRQRRLHQGQTAPESREHPPAVVPWSKDHSFSHPPVCTADDLNSEVLRAPCRARRAAR